MWVAAYAGYFCGACASGPGQSGEPSGDVSLVLRLLLPRLHGCEAGRTELGGLHHHGRRMIFTGGKRSSAVLAACEKRRSGLAPKTTQGPGTKTESSKSSEWPSSSPPGSVLIGLWSCGRCLRAGIPREGGAGLRPASSPPIWLVKIGIEEGGPNEDTALTRGGC